MQRNGTKWPNFEHRALVAIACYFVVMQAFLGAMAAGFAAGHMRAAGADFAAICYSGHPVAGAPTSDQTAPRVPCGLCVFASAGGLTPADTIEIVPTALVFTSVMIVAVDDHVLPAFAPRAGHARAPPAFV